MFHCIQSLWRKYGELGSSDGNERRAVIEQINDYYINMIDFVNRTRMNNSTIACLLRKIEEPENAEIYKDIMRVFFTSGAKHFRRFLIDSEDSVPILQEDYHGDIILYDYFFKKVTKIRNFD